MTAQEIIKEIENLIKDYKEAAEPGCGSSLTGRINGLVEAKNLIKRLMGKENVK